MAISHRSNPTYARLAKQVAICDHMIEYVLEVFVGNETAAPTQGLECSLLPAGESQVGEEDFLHYISELKDQKASAERELNRFNFIRIEDGQQSEAHVRAPALPEPPRAAGSEQGRKKRRRKRGRGGRGTEAPAED